MKTVFYGMLGLSIVIDIVLGSWASANWTSFVSFFFKAQSDIDALLRPGPHLVGFVLALALFFYAALQILAFKWTKGEKEGAGYSVVLAFSLYLLISGVATTVLCRNVETLFGGLEFLVLDGARGAILGTLAVLARRAPATVTSLRVPKRHSEGGDSRDGNSRSGSSRSSGSSSDGRTERDSSHRRSSRDNRGSGSGRGISRGGSRGGSRRGSGSSRRGRQAS